MDEIPILSVNDESYAVKLFMSNYDAPAYVRRARTVQAAFDELIARCRRQREPWLEMVRLRLGTLKGLAGGWEALRPWLADAEQLAILDRLHAELAPRLRLPPAPTRSPRRLRQALAELRHSLERFNRRWEGFVRTLDLAAINALVDGYNRYYLVEKECIFRSPRVARQGWQPLEPVTADRLLALLPPLPVPRTTS
jgi:hypothetical protein